ncbi:MAG: Hsp20/alpha crystallin family protein [Anaerolineae bacterium]|nr:Hsp20/alpha crystallin family protein [Anaerolineae bacterium]
MVKLVRYNPANNVWRTRYNDALAHYNSDTARPVLRPAMDVIEREHELEVRLNLPGIAADEVNVEVEDHVLTISGEINNAIDEETERYTYRERSYGAFQRSVRLGETVDVENIDATYLDGVLALTLPKLPEAQPRQIAVKKA